jgi:hypothetical protein
VSERLPRLAERIRGELTDVDQVIKRAQEGLHRARRSHDDYYLDDVALNLHSFYAGLERLFQLIATVIDGSLPQGANWHQVLLQQMATEVPCTLPAVISEATRDALDEYRGFRHIVRHVYTFKFDPVRMQRLVEGVPAAFAQACVELSAFADFLEERAQSG